MKQLFTRYEWKTVVLFIASLVLSAASFFTTFDGMGEMMGIWPIAASITFGLQALLFVISWWLARNWFVGVSEAMFGTFIFLLCAAISIFFSFSSLFATIDQGRTNSETYGETRGTLSDSLNRIDAAQLSTFNTEFDSFTSSETGGQPSAYGIWSQSLEAVMLDAQKVPEQNKTQREALTANLRLQKDGISAELSTHRTDLETLEANSGRAQDLVTRKQAELDGALLQVSTSQARLAEFDIAIQTAEKRMEDERVTGTGPNFREARRQLNTAVNAKSEEEFRKSQFDARLTEIEAELFDLQTRAGSSATAARINAKRELIRETEENLSRVESNLAAISEETSQELTANTSAVTAQLRELTLNRDLSAFGKIAEECQGVLDAVRAIQNDFALPEGFTCSPTVLANEVSRLNAVEEAIEEFRAECIQAEPLAQDGISYQSMIDTFGTCLTASTLPSESLADYRQIERELGRLGGDNVHSFTIALKALDLGKDLAFLALFIAIAIDFLVVLCAFIGVSSNEPGQKDVDRFMTLAHLDPDTDDYGSDIHEIVHEPTGSGDKGSFKRVASWMTARDLARWHTTERKLLLLRSNAKPALLISTGARGASSGGAAEKTAKEQLASAQGSGARGPQIIKYDRR